MNQAKEIWVTFAGVVDLQVTRSFFDLLNKALIDRVTKIHLLIHSPGGNVNDGVALYNYLRHYPVDIATYNCGYVASAAAIAYLGAKKRVVSENGAFMVHKTTSPPGFAGPIDRLKSVADSVAIDDSRVEAILRANIALTDEQWAIHRMADLTLSAEQGIQCGFAHEIGYFMPGGPLFNI
jgi:ATP-dependent Clp protease protease subunit